MSDFIKRPIKGLMGLVQGDVEEAFSKQRKDIDSATTFTATTPADWTSPAPTTLSEAINRAVRAFVAGGGSTP